MITTRDIPVLAALGRYFLMNRRMIQQECYPTDVDGRLSRRRLSALVRDGYISKQRMLVVNPRDETPAPVYHLAKQGCQFLAEHFEDDRYLAKPTSIAQPMHLYHYLAVANTHILLDKAIAQSEVKLMTWCNEQEFLNPENPDPKQRIRLYAELKTAPKKIICAPDSGFLLEVDGHRGVFYLEQDRDRDNYSHNRVAALKSPGYTELHRQQRHRKQFPATTLNRFTVVMVAPNEKRRDALRRAFHKKTGADFWRFASLTELTPQTFLHERVWYRTDSAEPQPLVKTTAPSTISSELTLNREETDNALALSKP
ncbi:replication-relaxation family protein [Gimesia fumaroli]|uniref:Replication-relaxation n=1 Tax=Gimesia fumaroli TaxID=2527976 RepID=A0A518I608_9PLAN|nr:replication-relaxation family protein [Gimesia fumaroli]QDV48505.1 hypothetical protein Enr17x_05170 [Gimesia fumaroli]